MTPRPRAKQLRSASTGFWSLSRAFAAAVAGERAETERALRAAFRAGLEKETAFEAFRMVHLFAGFPRNLTALEALHAAVPKDTRRRPPRRERVREGNPAAGRAAFGRIYGAQADAVRETLTALDPAVARWIAVHAYGRVLSRPGLRLRERELLAVAALAASRQEKQLASHARGAVRCGARPAEVRAAIEAARPFLPAALAQAFAVRAARAAGRP